MRASISLENRVPLVTDAVRLRVPWMSGGSIQPGDAANLASRAQGELEKVETRRHRTSGVIATIPEDCLAAGGTLALDQRADPRAARRIHAGGVWSGER